MAVRRGPFPARVGQSVDHLAGSAAKTRRQSVAFRWEWVISEQTVDFSGFHL
ncbi:hypothetical protein [Martelella alba]|uniref:hypothetical protein n=1 Tax=Martelella alba TaxID=2590451 RepID=UPI001484EEE3|nr:hypothetical protein [Martelella alba]